MLNIHEPRSGAERDTLRQQVATVHGAAADAAICAMRGTPELKRALRQAAADLYRSAEDDGAAPPTF